MLRSSIILAWDFTSQYTEAVRKFSYC